MLSKPDHTSIPIPENNEIQRSNELWPDFIQQRSKQFKSTKDEMERQIAAGQSSQRTKPLIQRVPPVLYNMKADFRKCFEPRLVALGPLHHGKPEFNRAEQSKLKIATLFALENNTTDDVLFGEVMAEIKELRKCYDPEDIKKYNDDELAWMLFIDGCAVLCAIHYYMKGLAVNPEMWEQSITDFIAQNLITNAQGDVPERQQHANRPDYAHLLERLREEHLTGEEDTKGSSMIGRLLLSCGDSRRHRKTFRSIKELRKSGIYVKPTKTNNIKKISFSCNLLGKLMMPRLLVDDSTASKFLNMVALEMCRDYKNNFEVTTYLYFLDSLIDTPEDVKELRVTGMLHNYFGSDEEVADLFNKMSKDLVPDQQRYSEVIKNIHKYCNNPWTAALSQAYYTSILRPASIVGQRCATFSSLVSCFKELFGFML